jgi:hypothetical protein
VLAWLADLFTGRRGLFATGLVSGVGAIAGWFLAVRVFAVGDHGRMGLGRLVAGRLGPRPRRLLPVPQQALTMGRRTRRFIAMLGVLVFLIVWIWAVDRHSRPAAARTC